MKYALLFPGQGSQSVGMLRALARQQRQIQDTFDEASTVLGWDLKSLVEEGPDAELNRTARTQPALLASGVAVWRVWQSLMPLPPTVLAGHSLGEYTALVCAGAIDFADALKLVELRGNLMQEAAAGTSGASMTAILGPDEASAEALCAAYVGGGLLEAANFNAPGQVVVATDAAAREWLQTNGKDHGVRKIVELAMSVPSHCSLMRGAADKLGEQLKSVTIKPPELPVLHNLDAQARSDPGAIRTALSEQLYRPVRWTQIIHRMQECGVKTYLECGPGKVLSGLNKRMIDGGVSLPLEDPAYLQQAVDRLAASTQQGGQG